MLVSSIGTEDPNWITGLFQKREPVLFPKSTSKASETIQSWKNTFQQFHNQRHIVWRDGNAALRLCLRNIYTFWLHCIDLSLKALDQTELILQKYGGKNISRLQILIGLSLGGLFFSITLLFLIQSHQTRKIINAHQLGVQDEKESYDEYDYEDDFDEEEEDDDKRTLGLPPHIRRLLNGSRNRINRSGSRDSASSRIRQTNHIRLVSSDPQSQLSGNAIELDLNNLHIRPGHSPIPHSRKRKESGKLLPSTATQSECSSSTSSASSSPRLVHTAGRAAKQRRTTAGRNIADHDHKRPSRLDSSALRNGKSSLTNDDEDGSVAQSPNSITSFASAKMEIDGLWVTSPYSNLFTNKLTSILRREPQAYASLPETPLMEPRQDPIAQDTQISNDSAWTVSEFANSDIFHTLPPASSFLHSTGRLPPGAGRGSPALMTLRNASAPRLGFLTPEQTQALWPEKRERKVKLREPDWRPYTEIHERARERQEKLAEMNIGTRSGSPMLVSGSSVSEEGSGSGNGSNTGDEEDEFWFERFTKSTAASGRDWDWRKRRLRQQANARLAAVGGTNSTEGGLVGVDGIPVQNANGPVAPLGVQKPLPLQPSELVNIPSSESGLKSRDSSLSIPQRTAGAPLLLPTGSENMQYFVQNENSREDGDGMKSSVPSAFEQGRKLANGQVWPRYQSSARTVSLGSTERYPPPQPPALPFSKRSRRFSDTDQKDADEAVSVPGRFSSLKPKEVKKMIMRGINTSSKPDLRSAMEEDKKKEQDKRPIENEISASSNGLFRESNHINARGWTVEQSEYDTRKNALLGRMNSNFAASTPELVFTPPSNPNLHQASFGGAPVWTHETIDSQQGWSSADAYGSSPPGNSASNGVEHNQFLGHTTTGGNSASGTFGEDVLTEDLTRLYGKVYTSEILSPHMNGNSEESTGPHRNRPIRHETMPLLHSLHHTTG